MRQEISTVQPNGETETSLSTFVPFGNRGSIYGGVMVSTGILRQDKRVEMQTLFKRCILKLNANDELALAA